MIRIILSVTLVVMIFSGCVGTIADAGDATGTKSKNILVKGAKDVNVVLEDINATTKELRK